MKAAQDAQYPLPDVEWIREEAGVGLHGAVAQEAIDLVAVLNALRTARQPSLTTDFERDPRPAAAAQQRN